MLPPDYILERHLLAAPYAKSRKSHKSKVPRQSYCIPFAEDVDAENSNLAPKHRPSNARIPKLCADESECWTLPQPKRYATRGVHSKFGTSESYRDISGLQMDIDTVICWSLVLRRRLT